MIKKLCFLVLMAASLSGCATNYFPLKSKNYSTYKEALPNRAKVVVLPFEANAFYYYSKYNTVEKAKEKQTLARDFAVDAIREEILPRGFQVIDYVPIEAFEKKDASNEQRLILISEIFDEYGLASTAIMKNLSEEKGKNFDYSVGIRVEELNQQFDEPPDFYLTVGISGYVASLTALENNAVNTTLAVLSLGMSKLMPVTDDTLMVEMSLIDAKTGEIVWVDYRIDLGRSLLVNAHIQEGVKNLLINLDLLRGKENS